MPIAANASYYGEIAREKAILRRLVEAGTKILQIGYAGEGKVDEVVDQAQAEVYKITDKRAEKDYAPLSDIMNGVLDEIEAISNREAGLYGVPTGFADLDEHTNLPNANHFVCDQLSRTWMIRLMVASLFARNSRDRGLLQPSGDRSGWHRRVAGRMGIRSTSWTGACTPPIA